MQLRPVALVSILLALPVAPVMAETRVGDTIVISQVVPEDFYAVGGRLQIDASVAGDAVLAASRVDIDGDVDGDVGAAGGQIMISGGVGDDLRAAGGEVSLHGFVTDHAAIVGGAVHIEDGSAIAGGAWIAAGTVYMAGQVGADLRVFARTVVIAGQIQGDVEITAREIRIDPGAVIGGQLIWHSQEPPLIAEDALILGDMAGAQGPADDLTEARPSVFDGWALGSAIFIAAAGVFWLSPALVEHSAARFHAAPGRTLVDGAIALALSPLLIVFLFVSLFGWLLGLLLLVAYVLAVLLSGLLGLLMLVQLIRIRLVAQEPVPAAGRSPGWRGLLLLLLPVTALALLMQSVPVLGTLFSMLIVLAGFGALASLLMRRTPSAA
jgi:cytoskeletal protein CcmA (bactofilin family)